jgi:hypothetical protein
MEYIDVYFDNRHEATEFWSAWRALEWLLSHREQAANMSRTEWIFRGEAEQTSICHIPISVSEVADEYEEFGGRGITGYLYRLQARGCLRLMVFAFSGDACPARAIFFRSQI